MFGSYEYEHLYISWGEYMHLFYLGLYLVMELLGDRLGIYLALVDMATLFSKMAVTFYTPTRNVQEFQLPHFLTNLNFFHLLPVVCGDPSSSWFRPIFSLTSKEDAGIAGS